MSAALPAQASTMRSLNGAVVMLASATAIVVTTEFIVAGLLPMMARDLDITIAEAGWFVTWFALSSAILGPLLTLAASRIAPHRILAASLLAFALGNLVATLVPIYPVVTAVRIAQGAALPVFVSVGNAAVAQMAGPGREGRAIAQVNIGVVVGIVLAIPAGLVVADHSSWPASFLGLGMLAAIATGVVVAAFPRLETAGRSSMRAQASILRRPLFQGHLLLSAILFTAMFAGYTYLAAFLEAIAGFDGTRIAAALMGFGVAGILGNWIAGRVVDRGPGAATGAVAFALMLATAAVSLAGGQLAYLLPLLAFWGAAHTAAFVLCQVRVMLAAPGAPAFASSLNISACNLGIAGGAVAGGWAVDHYGIGSIGFTGAVLAASALPIAILLATRSETASHRRAGITPCRHPQ